MGKEGIKFLRNLKMENEECCSMKIWKRALSIAVLCVTMAVLVACQDLTKDATVFVQGELDATYLGQYSQEYIDEVEDMTEADAQ